MWTGVRTSVAWSPAPGVLTMGDWHESYVRVRVDADPPRRGSPLLSGSSRALASDLKVPHLAVLHGVLCHAAVVAAEPFPEGTVAKRHDHGLGSTLDPLLELDDPRLRGDKGRPAGARSGARRCSKAGMQGRSPAAAASGGGSRGMRWPSFPRAAGALRLSGAATGDARDPRAGAAVARHHLAGPVGPCPRLPTAAHGAP